MTVQAISLSAVFDPFAARRIGLEFRPGMTLAGLAREAIAAASRHYKCTEHALAWFYDVGVIRVGGRIYERALWPHVKPKPGVHVELAVPVPGKGKGSGLLMVLAAVALTVATAGIAGGALAGALGSGTLAAGSLSANLLAAGVGLVGTLALNALTPSPSGPGRPEAQRELSIAGIQTNTLNRDEMLPLVIGRMRVSPPPLWPAHTVLEDKKVFVQGVFGLEGDYEVSEILINDIAIGDIPGAEYEVLQGDGGSPDTFLSDSFIIEDRQGLTLTNYELREEENELTELKDQTTPSNSYSKWHPLPDKPLAATRYGLRLVFDGGLANSAGDDCAVPIRIRIRRKGQVTWRYLPELHFKDLTGVGSFQQYVTLFWGEWEGRTPAFNGGFWASRNDAINCYAAIRTAGSGEAFQFDADSYFANLSSNPATQVPVLSGYTSGALTVSASSEKTGSTNAWKCFDNNTSTYWQPADNSLPGAWVMVDWGSGNTKTILCYTVTRNSLTNVFPRIWRLQGSDTGGTSDDEWITLHEQDNTLAGTAHVQTKFLNVSVIGAFRYHRVVFDSNGGAANEELSVGSIDLCADWSMARLFASGGFAAPETLGGIGARKVSLRPDGAEINLDTAGWPNDIYEVQVRRGWAYVAADMDFDSGGAKNTNQYVYDGAAANAYFFDDDGGDIYLAQNDINSRINLTITQNYYATRPMAEDSEARTTRIAFKIPSTEIQTVSALFEGKAREHNGSTWVDEPVVSRNGAAYARDALLLTRVNRDALPGEVINEDDFIDLFNQYESGGFTFDAVVQGRNVAEIVQMLCSVARATPRHGGQWGVTIDHDRSGESPVALITPESSRNLGTELAFDQIPHALRVTYSDGVDNGLLKDVTVYRAGYDAINATDIEAPPPYVGITTESAAIAQAQYDFGQVLHRKALYQREVNIEGLTYAKGDLVALADETVSRWLHYGLVKSILTSGGNVTGFELYGVAELSATAGQAGTFDQDDMDTDIDDLETVFGCTVMLREGGTFTAEITEAADTTTVTLATPVADTDQFAIDQRICIGPLEHETKRCVVQKVEHAGGDVFRLTLVDEANQIFA